MQDRILLSFRKRLKKRGYTNIKIVKTRDVNGNCMQDRYTVYANEPLSGIRVCTERNLIDFYYLIR